MIALVVGMYRVASLDGLSGWVWASITIGVCIAMLFIMPWLPFIRVFISGAICFVGMIAYKVKYNA